MRFVLLFAVLGGAFAFDQNGQRIVGGSPSTAQEYPYIANMQYLLWGSLWTQASGGSLITNTIVLSAAHCYVGDRPANWRVRLGTDFASSGGTIHSVSQLILHERYNTPALDNDIALVRLSTPAVLSATIQAARIAGPGYILPDLTTVYATGWGAASYGGSSPEQLQVVDLQIINQEVCAERYAYLKTQPGFGGWPDITDGMLCTGIFDIGGKDACQGDSGGPISHDGDIVIGIVSWGYECADPFYPGVSARVSQYTDWILDNV